MDQADQGTLDAQGTRYRHRYYTMIGDAPICTAGDHTTAFAYLQKILTAIEHGGWTVTEADRLRKLRAKWHRRAYGHNPYFEARGTRGGRLTAEEENQSAVKIRRLRSLAPYSLDPESDLARKNAFPASLRGRRARGLSEPDPHTDGDMPRDDPEPGDIELPTIAPARQYLIPGQDTKGHSHRVYCRVMPAHYRALCALERSKSFGFRTVGDTVRWCIDYGVRELTARYRTPQTTSALAQVDTIREILLDEQYYQEFPQTFELLQTLVNKHTADGARTEAVRLVAIVRHQIEQMSEDHWREKYMAELMRAFGHLLVEAEGASAVSFGGGA